MKSYKRLDKTILSEKGLLFKAESLRLMEYMKSNPLLEDRLSNELVGYAVAFGYGKNWMKKVGGLNSMIKVFSEHISLENDVVMNLINLDKKE